MEGSPPQAAGNALAAAGSQGRVPVSGDVAMGVIGKIVGGTIGFALGGPLGAIAGAAFGHAYDASSEVEALPNDGAGLRNMEMSQVAFFVATFSMLAKLVRVDGKISREEIDAVEAFMHRDLRMDPEGRHHAMNIFRAALDSPGSFEDFARQFHNHFSTQPQLLDLMIDILVRVSLADGKMSEAEESAIRSAVGLFHISESQYARIKARHVKDVDRHYATLGCSRGCSDDEVKQQYRRRVREFHPDTIAAKGLPEEFTQFANEKFRQIQEAYEEVSRERGMK
jgi:DnaJ like chaperone protein